MRQFLLLTLLLAGCPDAAPTDDDDAASEPALVQAQGVAIESVTINQGVQRVLLDDGGQPDDGPALIEQREALVRVHYVTDGDYDGGEVTGRLWLGDQRIDVVTTLESESAQDDLDTTVNFEVPAELMSDPLDWSVQILQPGDEDNPAALAQGDTEVEGDANVFRMVIAPFSYEFDGSGRLPDTSPEQIERIRETFLKLYPVSDVEITVRDPEPLNTELSPNGDGWILAGIPLIGYRSADGASDDVYYYGMFNPADTLQGFCGFTGCLLGVTLLNNDPPDTGSVNLRVALGVGFEDEAPWVAVHEIGHSHGRPHSPCGPLGNTPADIDPAYPHADGSIGTWGYDLLEGELVPPDTTDFMGYCDDQWTSAYTWGRMHDRGQNVNAGFASPAPVRTWDVVAVDRKGAVFGQPITRRGTWSGEDLDVLVDGVSTRGRFVRWDHMPGGLLAVPRGSAEPNAIEFVVDGEALRAER